MNASLRRRSRVTIRKAMSDDVDVSLPVPDASDTGDHYFRTFAKDAAALGGAGKDVKPTPAPKKTPAPTPAPAPTLVPETDTLPPPPPPVSEPNLPPAHIIPKAPSTDESRESVLARLRRKAGGSVGSATVQEHTKPLSGDRNEVLARLKANSTKAPVAPAPQREVGRTPEAVPSPIHTYKSDFADHTKTTGASRISVLARQQDAGTPAPRTLSTRKNNRYVFLGGAALIVLGIGSVWLAYSLVSQTPVLPSGFTVPSLITPNDRAELSGTGTALRQALVELAERTTGEGDVVVAYMTYASTTPEGTTVTLPVSGGDVIKALALPAPDIILRNVSSESTVGVVRAGGESRPFFILKVDSYERTFAGMLTWEATMLRDLAFMYPTQAPAVPLQPSTSTSTSATSTAPTATSTPSVFIPRFVDEIVENHDTRIVYGADGNVVLLYGYKDKETLIIAGSKEAFSELITRLASSRAQ